MTRLLFFRLSLFLLAVSSFAQVNSARMLSGVNAQTGSSYTFVALDSTRITTFSNGAGVAVTLPSGGTANFGAGAVFSAKNIGAGLVTITCSSCTINSNGTASATLTLATGQNADLYSDGTNYVAFAPPLPTAGSGAAPPGVGFPLRFEYIFGTGGAIVCTLSGGCNALGSQSGFTVTATETNGRILSASAAGSTNTVLGLGTDYGGNPGQGQTTLGSTQRFSMRLMTQVSTTARYWVGMMDGSGGQFSGATQNVTDTPNVPYCAFRFSTTTDTTWKAVCATDSSHQTVVDTGIAINTTASTLFEIAFAPAGAPTSATFSLNGSPVATVSTNLPTASYQLGYCFTVDNKNTATAESVVFFWSQILLTK
jgi:hypothetical protein